MAPTPKTPQQMYDEITAAYAQAEAVGNELQVQLEKKVAECNTLATKGAPGGEFMALAYGGEKDSAGHWKFGVKGRLQNAEMEVNPKPGRIAFTMTDEKGQPKGATQLLKIEKPAADLPEYLAASVIESVIEATEFKA